jgi:hypothetical protein
MQEDYNALLPHALEVGEDNVGRARTMQAIGTMSTSLVAVFSKQSHGYLVETNPTERRRMFRRCNSHAKRIFDETVEQYRVSLG